MENIKGKDEGVKTLKEVWEFSSEMTRKSIAIALKNETALKPMDDYKKGIYRAFAEMIESFPTPLFPNEFVDREEGWIAVKDAPLVTYDGKGCWICTEAGDKPFLAAIEVTNTQTKRKHWWIRHCIIKDEVGLCVVGDDDDEPAGWEISDVEYYWPIPSPPINNKS